MWGLRVPARCITAPPGATAARRGRDLKLTVVRRNRAGHHRHEEFIRFLNAVERDVPAGKLIKAVVDNYATHNHPRGKVWLERHPRCTFHVTPTSGSWLNAVENFFSTLTRKRIRRGSFHSIVDLQSAIKRYLAEHNVDPKPFVWKASAASILAKFNRITASSE